MNSYVDFLIVDDDQFELSFSEFRWFVSRRWREFERLFRQSVFACNLMQAVIYSSPLFFTGQKFVNIQRSIPVLVLSECEIGVLSVG